MNWTGRMAWKEEAHSKQKGRNRATVEGSQGQDVLEHGHCPRPINSSTVLSVLRHEGKPCRSDQDGIEQNHQETSL